MDITFLKDRKRPSNFLLMGLPKTCPLQLDLCYNFLYCTYQFYHPIGRYILRARSHRRGIENKEFPVQLSWRIWPHCWSEMPIIISTIGRNTCSDYVLLCVRKGFVWKVDLRCYTYALITAPKSSFPLNYYNSQALSWNLIRFIHTCIMYYI